MDPRLRQLAHFLHDALTYIGADTIVAFFGWLYTRRQQNFEDTVLEMFENSQHQQSRTADGFHNEYLKEHLSDVPMWVIFPIHTNWRAGLKWRLKTIPYQVRHFWRMMFFMPNKKKVNKTILSLWKRGPLVRDTAKPKYYTLR